MRRVLRTIFWRLREASDFAQLCVLRLTGRKAGVALMYHRIEPRQGDPEHEFAPPVSCWLFDQHVRYLRRRFHVVEPERLRDAAAARRAGQRFPAAITFDDDTLSHVAYAAPLLRRHGVPATFFLNGLGLDGPHAYWWERLQAVYDRSRTWAAVLPEPVLAQAHTWARNGGLKAHHVSEAVERLPVGERRALSERWREQLGTEPEDSGLRRAQVRELADGGFAVGFHGANHEPLSLLDEDEMHAELDGRREEVAAAAGRVVTAIAYPHGKAGPREAAAARARGFTVGFTVRDEAVTPSCDPLLQGRLNAQLPSVAWLAHLMVRQLRRAR